MQLNIDLNEMKLPMPTVESKNGKELEAIIKWPGGKNKELKFIIPHLPKDIDCYYEPFVGGGSVFTAIDAKQYFINDKSDELISLYNYIKQQDDDFLKVLDEIDRIWDLLSNITSSNQTFILKRYKMFSNSLIDDVELKRLIFNLIENYKNDFDVLISRIFNFNIENFISSMQQNVVRKILRMRQIEQSKAMLSDQDILKNVDTSFKGAFYSHLRYLYNNYQSYKVSEAKRIAIFYFIRNYTYSGMFRYNEKGEFNVPYGGIGYNGKKITKKIILFRSLSLRNLMSKTQIFNEDFEDFLNNFDLSEDDFIFLDPPYDSDFSTYAKNTFNKDDQQRLASFLINDCRAKWMMIIKNTDFIMELYSNQNLTIRSFEKKYMVSFMNRNRKDVQHLMITNYLNNRA